MMTACDACIMMLPFIAGSCRALCFSDGWRTGHRHDHRPPGHCKLLEFLCNGPRSQHCNLPVQSIWKCDPTYGVLRIYGPKRCRARARNLYAAHQCRFGTHLNESFSKGIFRRNWFLANRRRRNRLPAMGIRPPPSKAVCLVRLIRYFFFFFF